MNDDNNLENTFEVKTQTSKNAIRTTASEIINLVEQTFNLDNPIDNNHAQELIFSVYVQLFGAQKTALLLSGNIYSAFEQVNNSATTSVYATAFEVPQA
jgi:hypothetical protein